MAAVTGTDPLAQRIEPQSSPGGVQGWPTGAKAKRGRWHVDLCPGRDRTLAVLLAVTRASAHQGNPQSRSAEAA